MRNLFLYVSIIFLFLSFSSNINASMKTPAIMWQLVDEERYVYRFDLEKYNWRKIREIRELNKSASSEVKTAGLKIIDIGSTDEKNGSFKDFEKPVTAVVRDPDGKIFRLSGIENNFSTAVIPEDTNLIGRYLLGANYKLGNADINNDGVPETVYLSAKRLITHYKNGGKLGSASVVFIDDAEYMPLEIGPVVNTAESRFSGGTHRPHEEYKFMVKYMNKPLAGAKVVVYAFGSRWKKGFVTDENGEFKITPTDDRPEDGREWQKYLYTASYHDTKNGAYHVNTFPVIVFRNRPEWYSKAMGFTFWAIIGTAVVLIIIFAVIRRNRWQENRKLVIFDNYKIKEEI
ncbi:MAG: hypothetical protein JW864_18070 [Spirochaetes bacterium]|nr:hypothetical protein [Spirochaetota bacterium]